MPHFEHVGASAPPLERQALQSRSAVYRPVLAVQDAVLMAQAVVLVLVLVLMLAPGLTRVPGHAVPHWVAMPVA